MPLIGAPEIGESTDMARLDHIPTILHNLPNKAPRTVTYRKRKSLPPGYKPAEFDVCCGRGKRHWNHIGNVRFRRFIQSNVDRYMEAPTKNDKTNVVVSIVDDIRNMGGHFLKEDLRGNWYDIGDQQAREKVGHSLRDQVSTIHRQQQKHAAVQQHKVETLPDVSAGAISGDIKTNGIADVNTRAAPPQREPQLPALLQQPFERAKQLLPQRLLQQAPISFRSQNQPPQELQQHQQQRRPDGAPERRNAEMIEPITEGMIEDDDDDDGGMIYAAPDDDGTGIAMGFDEDDDDAQSDGSNERTARRSTLRSSMIIDKFARRPSFASAVADPSTSFSTARSSSKRSSGWSFLNDLDYSMVDQFDGDFQDMLEPIQYKSQG